MSLHREEFGEWVLVPWEDDGGYLTRVAGDPIDRPVKVTESSYADALERKVKSLKQTAISYAESRDAALARALRAETALTASTLTSGDEGE